ncbi:hypothetical protein CYMTET_55470 [Cymbomonas tetramitiformis]|uniref:Cation efflux protein transmembrane domain-containing protein n=1 Tax=Cymbomonas tetramitiformis TaxID=36881 RepID=A0AAE0BE30_9CHLO|nr:hypothetical protein CYMTET_55470 [Cymbomonas tetramitiformis]|eukprot:gene20353-24377_t
MDFDAENPDCLTLAMMGDHIDPKELKRIPDAGYAKMVLITTATGGVVNILLSLVKFFTGIASNSHALVADAVHSLSDVVSDVVASVAGSMSAKGKDEHYPYGYGKWETVGALWVGIVLILTAGSILVHLWEEIQEALSGNPIPFVGLPAVFVALGCTLVKEVLYQVTYQVGNKVNSEVLKANAWHHRSDALSSLAALVGIVGARAGVVWADAAAGAVVACLMGKVGVDTSKDCLRTLADANCLEDIEADFEQCISKLQSEGKIQGKVKDLRARRVGRKLDLDLVLHMSNSVPLSLALGEVQQLKKSIVEEVDNVREVLVELSS